MILRLISLLIFIGFFSKTGSSKELSSSFQQTSKIYLPNGIEVLLISDPSFAESSASLSVEAGSWDDPEEHPGMAHFVEHLLFLGSEAYPGENDFSRYVLERGGEYNADTRWDRTVYGFSIPKNSFFGALDLFSHLFIDPLFTSAAIQREMHAVHHEFEDLQEDDSLRLWRVLKESGNPDHPNRKLSCGNLTSLSKIRQSDVKQWFKNQYRPENMKLVLMSSESLEDLESQAYAYFSQIPVSHEKEKIKSKREKITSSEQRGCLIYLKPALKNRSLFLIWEIPSTNSQAVELLQATLDQGHSNSLVQTLEKQPYVRKAQVEFWKIAREQGLFMINIALSDEGIFQYEEVISKCFQILKAFKQVGVSQNLAKKTNQYFSFESTLDGVIRASSNWIDDEVECGAKSVIDANSLLLHLNPSDCIYALVASPEEIGVSLSRIEKWMGSAYTIRKISEEKLQRWSEEVPYPFASPIQESKEGAFEAEESEIEAKDPVLLLEDERGTLHWIEPSLENSRSLACFFLIERPSFYSSKKQGALTKIFAHRLNKLFKQGIEEAVSVFGTLEVEGSKMSLFLNVPKGECLCFFRSFFSLLKTSKTSRDQFEKSKKELFDSYFGEPPLLEYAEGILDSILNPEDLHHMLLEIEFEEYEAFESSYFDELFIDALVLGGESKQQIIELWKEVTLVLDAKPYFKQERAHSFPSFNEYRVLYKTPRKGNALLLFIETAEASKELEAVHKVLSVLLHTEFFNELRTKQQTAYQLHSWGKIIEGKICHYFSIQSSTHTPEDLLDRVEGFLNNFSNVYKSLLSLERFEWIRESRILEEKDADVVESLKRLTYEQVLNQTLAVVSKENRRQIAVLIEGSKETEECYGSLESHKIIN